MCSSLSLQLVLYSSWSKHTLAAQMCCSLSTTGVPSYFPCKLNPLKHHSHLQPCSFRYLTPVQICLEFKMMCPILFIKLPPSPFSEKIGRKQKPPNHQESTIWPVWWLTTQFCPQILKNVSITSIPPEPLISGVVCHARDQSIARPAWPNPETYYLGIRNAVGGQWSKKHKQPK